MSDILLEKNGIENTNIDGARFNRFCAGHRNGIIRGAFSECAISLTASNIIAMSKGELLISGFRVISEAKTFEYTSFPTSSIRYQIIAQLDLTSDDEPSFSCFVREVSSSLTQDDFFSTTATGGTYQIEIARFTLTSSGIEDLVQTIDIIKGSSSITSISVGDVVTEKIDYTLDAEVDIDEIIDDDGNVTFNYKFSLPIDMTEIVTTVETAAASAESAASEALTSATSALTAATNAETSAAAALVSATNAEESAASAQTSASNAETSASSAQDSADIAVTTANSALEIASSFEDRISTNSSNISSNTTAIEDEVTARSNADTILQTNIDNLELASGATLSLSIDSSTYVMTISLLNSAGTVLSTGTVDLPLETMVVGASYLNGTLTLTLQNGTVLNIDISSIVDGLVSQTDFDDLESRVTIVENSAHTHSNKSILDAISASYTTAEQTKLSEIETGAQANVQADWSETDTTSDAYILNKPTIPEGSILYDTTGENTDGSMTQAATTEALASKQDVFDDAGSDSEPIYFSDGVPVVCGNIYVGNNIQIGVNASSDYLQFGMAIGNSASVAGGSYSIALGTSAKATSSHSTAIGTYATATSSNYAIAIGSSLNSDYPTTASGAYSIAIGGSQNATSYTDDTYQTYATADYAIALGYGAKASGQISTAIGGYATTASGTWSIAIGANATASETITTAIGTLSSATGYASIAIGTSANATAGGSIQLGAGTNSIEGLDSSGANNYPSFQIGSYFQIVPTATGDYVGTVSYDASTDTFTI